MGMTHYMELLATNQPWNLIFYMAIPVILAEAMVATEFFVAFNRVTEGPVRLANRLLGLTAGLYFFFAVFLRLMITSIPHISWRGPVDVIAVVSYLAGVVPLGAIALMELGIIGRSKTQADRIRSHFIWVTVFLVVAHIAMIFGMLKPELIGLAKDGAKAMTGM